MQIKLFFIFALIILVATGQQFSVWDCSGRSAWAINTTDYVEAAELFQKWLYAWQHICNGRVIQTKHVMSKFSYNSGYASGVLHLLRDFVLAIECGQVYRPISTWQHASYDLDSCTLHMRGVDCFSKALSPCGIENFDDESQKNTGRNFSVDLQSITSTGLDSCGLAMKSKKSLQWVMGQLYYYVLRPSDVVESIVRDRLHMLYNSSVISKKGLSIAVHIRGSNSTQLDYSRKVIDLSYYIDAVDKKVAEMEALGHRVDAVFVNSDALDETVVSSQHLESVYPNRTYRFLVLNDVDRHEYKAFNSLDAKIRDDEMRMKYAIWLSDVHSYVKADIFIGSVSGVYFMVASMRTAHSKLNVTNTCLLAYGEYFSSTPQFMCEGSETIKSIWRSKGYGGPNSFNGGVSFESDISKY